MMTFKLPILLGALLTGASLADESYPQEVAEYVERREICEHFRREPWPEGSSTEDGERRALISAQFEHYCRGTDRALRELKRKYGKNKLVAERLERYETDIEGKQ